MGCSVYDESLIEDGTAGVPARPAASTSSSSDDQEAVFALHGLSFDQDGLSDRIGIDVDGVKTTGTDAPHECVGEDGNPPVDGVDGIDNSFGRNLMPTMRAVIGCLEDDIALSFALGEGTILVRMKGWNGRRDDATVEVSMFSAIDGTSMEDPNAVEWGGPDGLTLFRALSSSEAPPPAWDGEDYFYIDPTGLLVEGDLDRARFSETDAYISKGRLVMALTSATVFDLITPTGGFQFALDGFLMADLSEDQQTMPKVMLVGRFSAERLVDALEPLGFCEESTQAIFNNVVTAALDVRADPDIGTPDNGCTGMSVALTLQGTRANIAPMIAPRTREAPNPCDNLGEEDSSPVLDACCVTTAKNRPETYARLCDPSDRDKYEQVPLPIPVPAPEGF